MVDFRGALVIENQATAGSVTASSQELTMPAANLLSPHPSERWRTMSGSSYFVLDKRVVSAANTFMIKGVIASASAQVRLRLSEVDSTAEMAEIYDSGWRTNGSTNFDIDYFAACWCLDGIEPWRYARLDIVDPLSDFNEIGCVCTGQREAFDYNFKPGGAIKFTDRSGVQSAAGGATLVLDDNWFRSVDLSFDVTQLQRYGLFETLDRVAGRRRNVLLIIAQNSDNLARDSIFGLVSDPAPNVWAEAIEIYGKQLRISERV